MKNDDIKFLMSVPQGRSFFWSLLSDCNIFHTSFSSDLAVMSFNAGKRDIGLKVFDIVTTHCHDNYVLAAKEAKEREQLKNDEDNLNDRD